MKNLEIKKLLDTYNKGEKYLYTEEQFSADCKRYIKAIKEGRMMCSIGSVAPSGMSRTIKFVELTKRKGDKQLFALNFLLNFYQLFKVLGYKLAGSNSDYFRIHGCGMDMVFHTNYTIIHVLARLGFISAATCKSLAQSTPHII